MKCDSTIHSKLPNNGVRNGIHTFRRELVFGTLVISSLLITGMTAGAIIVNMARHHTRAFHEIEHIEWPFMILFFSLAGMSLDLPGALAAGTVVAVYVVARAGGRIAGCRLGAVIAQAPDAVRRYMGMALLPQAGVAIGMALVASNRFPEYRQIMLPIVIASTVVFEIVGPVFTRFAIRHTPENQN